MADTLPFFVLTFAVTWTCWIPVAAGAVSARTVPGGALVLLGTIVPSLVALALAARREHAAGVNLLLGRIFRWQVAVRWYVFAAGYTVAVKLAVALLHRLALGSWPRFGSEPLYVIPFAILLSTPVQAGEEIGWRGFALPRMAERLGYAWSGILIGLIWALWHLPLFFVREADTYGQPFFVFLLQVTALSVAITWLFARTGGSLLLPMLLHAAVNNSKDIVPSATPGAMNTFGLSASPVAWLTVLVFWICAACFLARMPRISTTRARVATAPQ